MEEQGGSPWDFSHLPTDALCVVFEHLFAPSGGDVACLPLSVWFDRWHAVSLVCGHWREVRAAVESRPSSADRNCTSAHHAAGTAATARRCY